MIESVKRILVVDDEPEFVKTIVRHLKRNGFSLESAGNGQDAQQKIERSVSKGLPFDLVITDLVMPTMNGIELLSWIMQDHPEISVLVITGFGEADLAVEMIRSEMDGFALKPFTPEDMIRLISEIDHKRKNCLNTESGDGPIGTSSDHGPDGPARRIAGGSQTGDHRPRCGFNREYH